MIPQLQSKPENPTRNFFTPLRSTEMDADHENDADDTTKHQQHQEPSSQANRTPSVVLNSQVHTDIIARQLKGLYVCMCKRWAIKSSPCTTTFNDLLCYPHSSALY
jgi:hypothetical protein